MIKLNLRTKLMIVLALAVTLPLIGSGYFWNDPEQAKYRKAYIGVFPNVWHHGDYVEITETGGVIIYGRSDATLNPSGVRDRRYLPTNGNAA